MHVRVCVDCGEEYRPEIVACADCGGRLEDRDGTAERPSAPAAEPVADDNPEAEFTHTVFHAEKATDLTGPADRLIEAGIPFRLRPARGAGYRLLVTAEDSDRSLAVLGLVADRAPGDGDAVRPCPACETPVAGGAAECPECGLAVGDEAGPTCDRCGQALDGPDCPDCGR
jgi:hypothetical protein